ncbi:MAG TPA: glutamate synthase subunit beta [Vicinamibacterales bacterium]|nr:glutamate synthase subunit beta [Vicinamibacterales bacterium]
MGNTTGFLEIRRSPPRARPVHERILDWQEVYLPAPEAQVREQGARCMDCGIPFCHQECPLGNVVPDWNDAAYHGQWRRAHDQLRATNNFPEFTGRLCPAPCEGSCVLGINDDPVTIKSIELSIVERAFDEGWISGAPPPARTGKAVAIVGSGPAGLAAADQLNMAGHAVTVFERADRIGGLLRYGIPEFKLEKRILDRRLALMRQQGVSFRAGVDIGQDITAATLRSEFGAVVICTGAGWARDLKVPGRELGGIHLAVDYLTEQNRVCEGDTPRPAEPMSAEGRHVVIIGGGDTGADCLGTAHRQGAASVRQFELLPRPPGSRAPGNPWPQWPHVFRTSAAHEEGGERLYCVSTERFLGTAGGRVKALEAVQVDVTRDGARLHVHPRPGSRFEVAAGLVLLAMGFHGTERRGPVTELDLRVTDRGTVWRDERWMTSAKGVFAAGDAQRGQSLIVWAIADGRSAAGAVDAYLMS